MAYRDRDGSIDSDVRIKLNRRFQGSGAQEKTNSSGDVRANQYQLDPSIGRMVTFDWSRISGKEISETFIETAFGLWIFKPWIEQDLGRDFCDKPKKPSSGPKSWFRRGRKA